MPININDLSNLLGTDSFDTALTNYIIAKGDINAKDATDYSLLHHAAIMGNLTVVKRLVQLKADLNIKGAGSSVIEWAFQYHHTAIVIFLIKEGAEIETLLKCAEKRGDIYAALKECNRFIYKPLSPYKSPVAEEVTEHNKVVREHYSHKPNPPISPQFNQKKSSTEDPDGDTSEEEVFIPPTPKKMSSGPK